jgi:hypothetical protein
MKETDMQIRKRRHSGLVGVIAIALGLLGTATAARAGATGNPGVLPPGSSPHGKSYGEWGGEFWRWQFSLPVDRNPIFDTAACDEGQSGHVWFLGGTTSSTEIGPGVILGQATRDCTVPIGTALFFPIVNVECSTVEGNGTTEEELRDCANFFADFITDLSAELDGLSLSNLSAYRKDSPLFTFGPLPDNNVLQFFGVDAPAGTVSPSVSDGIHLMLAPLSRGEHALHFHGTLDLSSIGGPMFIQDITYHLTVSGRK